MGAGLDPQAIVILVAAMFAWYLGEGAVHGVMWIWHHLPVAGHAIVHVFTFGKS